MDRLESLGNTLSQITLYDIKSMYEQAKNVVLNVSEIEAKVREATNDDPWGASSTLMQDIANRTFNYPDFNEIMPSIYARFMEKEARQWRQIYKALQLLEYLIKNGSERVVDDARSHVSTIKMLRNFHYIDDKGKDEGINVRNRAKEIVELLGDVEKIRAERRKAKANKSKYTGTGNDGMNFSSGGSRYGGFGSESSGYGGGSGSYGGGGAGSSSYSGNDYNSGGSYGAGGSGNSGGFRDSDRRGFEEYNAGDDEIVSSPSRSLSVSTSPTTSRVPTRKTTAPIPAPAPAPAPVVDLLGGFDDDSFGSAPVANTNKALPAVSQPPPASTSYSLDDDDFGDFSAAPVSTTTSPLTAAAAPSAVKPNLMEMLKSTPAVPAMNTGGNLGSGFTQTHTPPPMAGMNLIGNRNSIAGTGMGSGMGGPHRSNSSMSHPAFFGNVAPLQPTSTGTSSFSAPIRPMSTSTMVSPKTSTPSKSSANFDDLWSMSLGSKPATPTTTTGAKSIKDLEKEKANKGLWGGQPQQQQMQPNNVFGSFGTAPSTTTGGGGDDLLL